MKVPNNYRLGTAIRHGVTTNVPMIKKLEHLYSDDNYGNNGGFVLPMQRKDKGFFYLCIASDGMGWQHVSVSILTEERCPTWEEMCYVKSFFWEDEEAVIQLHPPKSMWVNNHAYCLHLWRPIDREIPLPLGIMVGRKKWNISENKTQ